MIDLITSLQNPRIRSALRLHTSRGRQTQGRIIIFGSREVERAIDSGVVLDELFFAESLDDTNLFQLQNRLSPATKIIKLTSAVFSKLAYGDRTEGVIATATRPETRLEKLQLPENSLIVITQAIEKPGNLGAIIRSADGGGAAAVISVETLTDFYHPNSIRASTGSVFGMPLATSTSAEIHDWLGKHQFETYVAILNDATDFFASDLTGNVAIVLGSEANGLDEQWFGKFRPVKLPMLGVADSLNVSVTASIMIYEAMRQRNSKR